MRKFPADYQSRRLEDLDPQFRDKVERMLESLRSRGFIYRPFFTLRGPEVQARLWAQSRTKTVVSSMARTIENSGAPRLAALLRKVKAGGLPRVTGALPGRSWHQYGLAVDLFREIDGRADWRNASYIPLRDECPKFGLVSGASFQDWVHVQSTPEPGPPFSWGEVERRMSETFLL